MSRSVLDRPIEKTGEKVENYQEWRNEEMAESWAQFSDAGVDGLDVLDFGCGTGPLSLYLAETSRPKSITGVDLEPELIALANHDLAQVNPDMPVRFLVGQESGLPVENASADRLLAFDCMEHVMDPESIFADWHRVLRKGGKALLVWVPFAGPFGPHMNSMIPVPWARYVFGERAMFETAERIYDDPDFVPRHWDKDEDGNTLPNKWRQWRSFAEQGYLNELGSREVRAIAVSSGFEISRFERHGVMNSRKGIGAVTNRLAALPFLGDFLTSYVVMELRRI